MVHQANAGGKRAGKRRSCLTWSGRTGTDGEKVSQQLTQHPLVCDWLLLVTLLALVSLRCGQWGGTRPHGGTEQGPSFPEVA